jgi:crossover junction endodeoxyribonuclease RusA
VTSLKLTIPLIPPDLNHYVRHTRDGRHYVTAESKAFKEAIGIFSAGKYVLGRHFEVEAFIFLGKGQKGDVDGFSKLILDGLAKANVFCCPIGKSQTPCPQSDAYVTDLILRKRRDVANPRTEITVRVLG